MSQSQPSGGHSNQHQLPESTQAAEDNKGHVILLIQFSPDDNSRTFLDYENLKLCVDGLCNLYEQNLKVRNPEQEEIKYDVAQLFEYIDTLTDMGAMLYNVNIKAYEPKGKEWIKEQIYKGLKHQTLNN